MVELLAAYICFSVATASVYHLFYYLPVSQDFDHGFTFKLSMFLAVCVIAPKVFYGLLTLKEEDIKESLYGSLKEQEKSRLED